MNQFKALCVKEVDGEYVSEVKELTEEALPQGEVTIRVHYSDLNFKDMLAITGAKGIAKSYPHVPGIDCAGVVLASESELIPVGKEVFVTGFDLGMSISGGFSQLVKVPADWVMPCLPGLSLMETMAYGTPGVTAAMCIDTMLQVGITPDFGEVLVTGATGSVGTIAVLLLKHLGYRVVASTGKPEGKAYCLGLGADEVLPRSELEKVSKKGLLKERWGAVIDTVGGQILVNALKATRYGGSVMSCGLAQSAQFEGSVYPFILRGINLMGIDSANLPAAVRAEVWENLSGPWKLPGLSSVVETVSLEGLLEKVQLMKSGHLMGRIVVDLNL